MDTSTNIDLPPENAKWNKNNPRGWPHLQYEDLVDYLILRKAYDGKEMRAFRSLYAKNYVNSGWLGDVYDFCNKDLGVHFLKATVSPSQPGVGRKDYKTWTAVSTTDSVVKTGYCTCPAGAGTSCSHVSALLYAVIMAYDYGVAGETCTDKPCAWGKGASQILACNVEFSDIVNDNHDRKFKKDSNDKVSKPQHFLDHKDLLYFASSSNVKPLWECKGTLLNRIFTAKLSVFERKLELEHFNHEINTDKPVSPLCSSCQQFFDKYVNIDDSKCQTLNKNTTDQQSSLWMDSRKVRITASKVASIPKTARADPEKYVTNHIYQRFKGCEATKHGNKYEAVARDWFQKETGLVVKLSGIVIRDDEKYLAASPDGILEQDTIIEIKCPTKPLNDYIESGKYDIVKDENGVLSLSKKGKNGYYTQVQMTMFCTKAKLCKFIAWTENYQCIIDVPYDQLFVSNLLPRIRYFYFKHMLVRLADEFHFGRLQLSSLYKNLCTEKNVK